METNELKILSDGTKAEALTTKLHMTNEDFQDQLKLMKLLNQKTVTNKLNIPTTPYVVGKHHFTLSNENEETGNTYYIKFVNSVLKTFVRVKLSFVIT